MSNKTISVREAVLRERAAFQAGVALVVDEYQRRSVVLKYCGQSIPEVAASRYPLPKITRARVVEDESGVRWRVVDEIRLQFRLPALRESVEEWRPAGDYPKHCNYLHISPARVRLWADLLAHPTEEVDDDGSASDRKEPS